MTLTLNKRVWLLAERLYIHAYNADKFLKLLALNDIDYDGAIIVTSIQLKVFIPL
jgi:hypothetical protein